jgi:hypothetical protein
MELLLFLVRLFIKSWWLLFQEALLVSGFFNHRR